MGWDSSYMTKYERHSALSFKELYLVKKLKIKRKVDIPTPAWKYKNSGSDRRDACASELRAKIDAKMNFEWSEDAGDDASRLYQAL